MIFESSKSIDGFIIIKPINQFYDAWDMMGMINNAFPSTLIYIICAGGYENAILIKN